MAGMTDDRRVNVVTRYSVGMVSMLCVSISVRQIATAIQLSLVFFGLRRSGRYRNGSATFVGISVIKQLQSSILFANSAIVGVRALSLAAFMPCSVRTKLGSILGRLCVPDPPPPLGRVAELVRRVPQHSVSTIT